MAKFMFIGAAAAIAVFALLYALSAFGSGAGIITLPDYPHGVVLCGEALVVNSGHYLDPQVSELVSLALEMCP